MSEVYDVFELTVDASLNPWSHYGEQQLDSLLDSLSKISASESAKHSIILLQQLNNSYHLNADFTGELLNQCWLEQIARRILKMRLIFDLLASFPGHTLYLTSNHCFSFYFELALICDRWFAGNVHMQIGFPEIEIGSYPSAGVFEIIDSRWLNSFDIFYKNPVFYLQTCSEEAYKPEFLIQSLKSQDLRTLVDNYLVSSIDNTSHRRHQKIDVIKAKIDLLSGLLKSFDLDKAPVSVQKIRDFKEAFREHKIKKLIDKESEVWIIKSISYLMLSTAFISKLSRQATSSPPLLCTDLKVKSIILDIQNELPSISFLRHMLEWGRPVLFCAKNSSYLLRMIVLLSGNLKDEGIVYQKKWRELVSWYVGSGDRCEFSDHILISRKHHYSWSVRYDGVTAECFDVCPAVSHDDKSIFEIAGAQPEFLEKFFEMNALQFVCTKLRDESHKSFPVSLVVRCLGLNEILKTASTYKIAVSHIVSALADQGWSFLGSDSEIERFLVNLPDDFMSDSHLILGKDALDQFVEGPSSWKLSKSLHSDSISLSEFNLSKARLSSHFGAFFVGIKDRLDGLFDCSKIGDLDLLICAAVGMPERMGSLLFFSNSRGVRRSQHELRQLTADGLEVALSLKF